MLHVFSDLEGIRIAIEMERRGESFYRHAARVSKSADTVALLDVLARDETNHRAEFEKLFSGEAGVLSDEAYDDETNAYLSAVAADVVFPGGLMALRDAGFEDSEAVLENAITSEKDSIMFYTELYMRARDEHAKAVFGEIIRQEKGHLRLLRQRQNHLKITRVCF